MFLGSLLGAGLSALPGVLNGVGGIINAAKGREQELAAASPQALAQQQEMIFGLLAGLLPSIIGGIASAASR